MIEESLLQYGAVGLFCAYLIYDKQVLMRKVTNVLERLCNRIDLLNSNYMYKPKDL